MKAFTKKALSLVLVTLLLVSSFLTVSAATQDDVMARLSGGISINGEVQAIPARYIKLAEDYMNANELTEEQLDGAIAKFSEAESIWAAEGVVDYSDLSASVKESLKSLVVAVAAEVGASVSFSGEAVTIVSPSGDKFETTIGADQPIKQTGVDARGLYVVAAVLLLSLVVMYSVSKKQKLCVANEI